MKLITALFLSVGLSGHTLAQDASPSQAFNDLVERYEDFSLDRDVQRRAQRGDLDAASQWRDVRPETLVAVDAQMTAFLAELNAIDANDLEASDQASYAVLDYILTHAVALPESRTTLMPFRNDSGFHNSASYTAMTLRLSSVAKAEAWIARLNAYPALLSVYQGWLEQAIEEGWTQPRDILDGVADQIDAQILEDPADSAFMVPLETLPRTIDQDERDRLMAEAEQAVADDVMPALEALSDFFRNTYIPAAREELGIRSVPGGEDWYRRQVRYHTSLDTTPEEVHQRGLNEVARIRADMEAVIAETGFEGTFQEFLNYLRTDPQFYAQSEEELLMRAAWLAKLADDQMPAFFGHLPRLSYGVRPVPDEIAPNYTTGRYWGGNLEQGQAGAYMVNTYALDQRPLYELPSLTVHEGVPGHHHQIAIAQELEDLPDFRKSTYITAFGEGWGLYTEFLAIDMGMYRTPYEEFGRLTYEMWRACRLVVDTGIHWYGWSREEAEACFLENSALAPLNITNEVSRYISWPGQALAYKTGELLIRDLRAQAEERLGEDFDIRAFHDAILEEGGVPLTYLEAKMMAWIEEQAED